MNEIERQQRKRQARRRLAAQRDRAGRLRGRVVAGSLICFVALWGVVFGQMASGNDPVLAPKAQAPARSESRRTGSFRRSAPPTEAIETTEPGEVEEQLAAPAPVEAEGEFAEPEAEFAEPETQFEEPEAEFEEVEPEPEPEPLTTGQS